MMFGEGDHWLGSKSYATIATNLLGGSGYTSDGVHPTAQRPPGYPLILMSTMSVSGKYWFAATILLQALVTVACLLLVFEITRLLWPETRAPWLALGLLMLHGPFMMEMISLRETVWFTLGLLGVARLLLRNTTGLADAIALGLGLAALYLLRPTGLMTALVTIPFLMRAAWTTRRYRFLIATVSAGVMLVAPWQVYTWGTFGAPGFFPSSLVGYNFCKGVLPDIASVYPWIDADTIDQRVRRLAVPIPIEDEHAVDAQYEKIAWTVIGQAPAATLGHMMVNALAFVSPFPIPFGQGRLIESEHGLAIGEFQFDWRALPFSPLILLILVAGSLGVIALLNAGGSPRRFGLWVTALFGVLLAVHTLTFVKTRYRLPLDALLVIPAGGWLARYRPGWLQRLSAAGQSDRLPEK